jgi:hypothetical protein
MDNHVGFASPGNYGARVNEGFSYKMTLVMYGLFGVLLALWDVMMIIAGLVKQLAFLGKVDSYLFRGIFIFVMSMVTFGVCADLGIAGGSLGLVASVAWVGLAICCGIGVIGKA